VKDAHDSALEKRPHVLDSVRMDVARSNVGLSMVDGLMRELGTVEPEIRSELVSVNFGSGFDVLTDEIGKALASHGL